MFKSAVQKALHNEVQKEKQTAEEEEQKYAKKQESFQDDQSDLNSMIHKIGKPKKTEDQIEAENDAMEAFIIECDKQKVLVQQILKNLGRKKLKFVN